MFFIHDGKIIKHYLQQELKVVGAPGVYPKAVTFQHGAKIQTIAETANNPSNNSAQNQKNRHILIRKRAKSPKELRHQYDARIEAIKQRAGLFGLDYEKVMEAYTSLDIKKLEQTIQEQEKLFERRKRVYAQVEKKHQQRTPEKISDIKKRAAERQEALEAIKYIQNYNPINMRVPSSDELPYKTAEETRRHCGHSSILSKSCTNCVITRHLYLTPSTSRTLGLSSDSCTLSNGRPTTHCHYPNRVLYGLSF